MQVDIQTTGFPLTEELRMHIERRLNFVFKFANRKINRVVVRLLDDSRNFSNQHLVCRIHTVIRGAPNIISEFRSDDLYAAIDSSIYRARKAVSKRMEKMKFNTHPYPTQLNRSRL